MEKFPFNHQSDPSQDLDIVRWTGEGGQDLQSGATPVVPGTDPTMPPSPLRPYAAGTPEPHPFDLQRFEDEGGPSALAA